MKKKLESDSPLRAATCSPSSDFEKGPWSYDLYADGLEPVALLNNPNHSQGEWVDIDDYRQMERERNKLRKALEGISKSDMGEGGCYYTNQRNIRAARAALQFMENNQDH
jgi:hypothetical protein